jgi:hypothetical protein
MISVLYRMRILFLMLALGGTLVANVPADYTYIECTIKPSSKASHHHTHPRIPFSRDPQNIETSDNWSGYIAQTNFTTPTPHSVTKVSGTWIVPNVTASAVDTACAIWVGIDGSGSPTVEQLGTSHDVEGGVAHHYAWFEMYPKGSHDIVGFPVEVGDSISASVTYVPSSTLPAGHNLFVLQITNNTKKVFTTIPCITRTDMQRLCAEWIVEAPYLDQTLPLSNFGTVYFSNCLADINNTTGAINTAAWASDSINMVADDGTLKATTSALSADGKSFSVAWQHN